MINCNWIPVEKNADKICHFGVGLVVSIIMTLLVSPIVGLVSVLILATAKEAYDYKSYGVFDFFDFFATVAGSIIGVMILHLVLVFM